VSDEKKPTPPSAGSGAATPAGCATAACPCPVKVVYKEDVDSVAVADKYKYGWDDFDTNAAVPWKSVEKGQNDTIKTEITDAANATRAEFKCADTAKATVAPAIAASDKQELTVTGVEKGETEINATCGGAALGKVKVATYVKKTKTVAIILVHEKNYNSTDISEADLRERLRKVYKQAVVEFTVTRLPAKTVEFDTITTTRRADKSIQRTAGRDGKIDVETWMTDEMKAVRDACKDDSYDYNLFIVDKPSDNSFGFMDFNQRYGFVHADQTTTPLKSAAHELGHGQGLQHTTTDNDNLMTQGEGNNMWLLRKNQWDKINS
jgi:hypothetical protein